MKAMTRQDFLQKIFDFENKKEWNYQGEIPCLIDFHDDECPPCNAIMPILDRVSEKYGKKIMFYKVDTKKEETLSRELGISNLPTLVFCPIGAKPVVLMGVIDEKKLAEKIEMELLNHG